MIEPIYIEIRRYSEVEYPDLNYADILNEIINKGEWEDFNKNYPWLSSINHQSGAVFNSSQIFLLLEEAQKLQKEEYVSAIPETVQKFIAILNERGSYMIFEGKGKGSDLHIVLKEADY